MHHVCMFLITCLNKIIIINVCKIDVIITRVFGLIYYETKQQSYGYMFIRNINEN